MFVFPRASFFPPFFRCRAAKCLTGQEEEEEKAEAPAPPPPLASVTALLDSQLKRRGFNPARTRHFTANQEEKCSISCKRIQNEGKRAPKRDEPQRFCVVEGPRGPDWVPTLSVFCLGLYLRILICPRTSDKHCETH